MSALGASWGETPDARRVTVAVTTPAGIREDVWRAMRAAALWRDASDEAVESLAAEATIADYEKGAIVFSAGSTPNVLGVVVDGHALGLAPSEGGHPVAIETYWPGDVVGAVSAMSELPYETDISAAGGVTMAMIPAPSLKAIIAQEPAVAMSVINEISRRWVAAVNTSKRNAGDVISRVADYLRGLPRTRLGGTAFAVEIPTTRAELAASLGTTPETLSRAFHTLQNEGLVESHDRMIIVPDEEALASRHDGDRSKATATRY